MSGTFKLKNLSCGEITSGYIAATKFAPLSGTYSGSLNLSQGGALAFSTVLTQDKLVDEDGKYWILGSAIITASQCGGSWTLADSFVEGDHFVLTYISSDNAIQLQASGNSSSDANSLTISSFVINGRSCDGYYGTGVLSQQPSGQ
jgi:hypothetical protein